MDPVPLPVSIWLGEGVSTSRAPVFQAACAWLHLKTTHPGVPFWDDLFPSTVPLRLAVARGFRGALTPGRQFVPHRERGTGLSAPTGGREVPFSGAPTKHRGWAATRGQEGT